MGNCEVFYGSFTSYNWIDDKMSIEIPVVG